MLTAVVRNLGLSLRGLARRSTAPACPVCDTGDPVLFESSRPRKLLICRDCRHVYWDLMPGEAGLNRFYAQEYCETHGQDEIQEGHRAYYREHVRGLAWMAGRPVDQAHIVDYGSSIPTLIREAAAVGFKSAVAVDVDEKSFAYARAHGLSILTPTDYRTQVPDGSLDVIRFSHVLEHLIDPHPVIATAVRKLRVGGVLYITQPGFPVFRAAHSGYVLKDSAYPKHLHFYNPISLGRLLARHPVEVVRMYTHPGADEVYAAAKAHLDLDYARTHLAHWADRGEAGRGVYANFPYYTGENSELFAIKR